jgi:uncharacterized surface protein with fasciclin (FAS1) repeats
MNNRTSITKLLTNALPAVALGVCATACVDPIDTDNRFTFTGNTVASFLMEHEDVYSHFIEILQRGEQYNLLKAYGTYTCFAPTNEAINRYLAEQDSIYRQSLLPGSKKVIWTGITSPDLEELSDSMCKVISKTHILPEMYLTTEMDGDVVPTKNFNDRYLTMSYGVDHNAHSVLYVNGAEIIAGDEKVENGVVHCISSVLNPSSNTLPSQIEDMKFLSIFSEALEKTGFADKLQDYKDFSYTDGERYAGNFDGNGNSPFPASRYYGFTAFVESDEVFHNAGIYTVDDLYKMSQRWYPDANNPDFTHTDNALNRFIAYHIVNKKLLYSRIVCYNLILNGYNSEVNLVKRSDRVEYYETMQGTLMKVVRPLSHGAYQSDVLINYKRSFTNPGDKYNCTAGKNNTPVNIRIYDPVTLTSDTATYPGYTQEALNGTILLIDHILRYDEDVMSGQVLNEIMRFDFSSLVPEFTNNDIRWCSRGKAGVLNGLEFYIPAGYGSNLVYNTEETRLYYLCPNETWHNYQGDEMMGLGAFDFKYKMPPVPEGTYEIRMGYSANNNRHIVQFYVDDEVTGIPVDLRILLSDPAIGYESDANTEDGGIANDKAMKNRGYVKGPTTYYYNGSTLARNDNSVVRKVVTTKYLGKGEHWIRFKNVKEDDDGKAQFMHDYLEIIPVGYLRREDISLEEKRK